MTSNISPININSQAIKYAQTYQTDKKDDAVKDSSKDNKSGVDTKDIPASDILGYMAAQCVDVQPVAKKTVDVAKYVTPEQAERIAGFVQGFESEVEKGLLSFDQEFPGNTVSDDAKLGIAVESFNKTNL